MVPSASLEPLLFTVMGTPTLLLYGPLARATGGKLFPPELELLLDELDDDELLELEELDEDDELELLLDELDELLLELDELLEELELDEDDELLLEQAPNPVQACVQYAPVPGANAHADGDEHQPPTLH
jgi:hypothetical protein